MGFLSSLFGSSAPNARLVELMLQLAQKPAPELEGHFYRLLLGASLRAPSPSLESQGLAVGSLAAGDDTKVRIVCNRDAEGRRAMLAFTGEEALLCWRSVGCDSIEMKFPELCALALSAGAQTILIDSNSPHCCLIPPDEVAEFAAGRVPAIVGSCRAESLAEGTLILSECPSPPPQALCDALSGEAAAHPAILKVYLVSATMGSEPPRPVAAVEVAPQSDLDGVIPPFVSGATVRLGGRPIPDVLPLVDGSPLQREARAHGTLVYGR